VVQDVNKVGEKFYARKKSSTFILNSPLINPPIKSPSHSDRPIHFPDAPTVYVLNCGSIVKPHAFEQLKIEINNINPEITVLTETHFNTRHSNELFRLPGFTLFRKDRRRRKGGGVSVYVRDVLVPQCLAENYNLEFTEAMWLRINFCNQSFLICACYHPPKPKYACTAFVTYLDRNIEAIARCARYSFSHYW